VCHELFAASITAERCFVKDEGRPLGAGLAGAGFKPVRAALVKSFGRERRMKSQFKTGR